MALEDSPLAPSSEDELRELAIHSLKKKAGFRTHLIVYVLVNLLLVGIWAASGGGYFWPVWVIGGWGVAIGLQAWDAYRPTAGITEDEISSEMEKLRGSKS
jgi:hypothetical protein